VTPFSVACLHKVEAPGSVHVRLPVLRPNPLSEFDARVRELVERHDVTAAVELLLEVHGPDLFGLLAGVLEDGSGARATYRAVAKRVAEELASFQWNWSAKIWLYSLAHRELHGRRAQTTGLRVERELDTEVWRNAGLSAVIKAVRRTLTEEERELLILRVDRKLDWHSLAATRLGGAASPSAIEGEARLLRARMKGLFDRVERLTEQHLQQR